MQEPGPDLPCDTVPGALRSDARLFFGLHFFWQQDFAKIPKVRGALAQCKSGPGNNMVSKRNRPLDYFSLTIHLYLASFFTIKYRTFEKTLARRNAH